MNFLTNLPSKIGMSRGIMKDNNNNDNDNDMNQITIAKPNKRIRKVVLDQTNAIVRSLRRNRKPGWGRHKVSQNDKLSQSKLFQSNNSIHIKPMKRSLESDHKISHQTKAKRIKTNGNKRQTIELSSCVSAEELNKATVAQLRQYLRKHGQPLRGRKADLITRIIIHRNKQ